MTQVREVSLPVTGMTCANCAATVERTLRKTEGVADASVNFASERASVRFDPAEIAQGGGRFVHIGAIEVHARLQAQGIPGA